MNDLTRIAIEAQNSVKLDREAERKRPLHILLAVIALCLAIYSSDRDYQEAGISQAMHHEFVGDYSPRIVYEACQRCPKQNVDGDWLRVEAIQRAEGGNCFIHCKYQEARL